MAIRPEAVSLGYPRSARASDRLLLEVQVDLCEPLGSETLLEMVPTAAGTAESRSLVRAKVSGSDAPEVGSTLLLSVPSAGIEVFDRSDGRLIWREEGP